MLPVHLLKHVTNVERTIGSKQVVITVDATAWAIFATEAIIGNNESPKQESSLDRYLTDREPQASSVSYLPGESFGCKHEWDGPTDDKGATCSKCGAEVVGKI